MSAFGPGCVDNCGNEAVCSGAANRTSGHYLTRPGPLSNVVETNKGALCPPGTAAPETAAPKPVEPESGAPETARPDSSAEQVGRNANRSVFGSRLIMIA